MKFYSILGKKSRVKPFFKQMIRLRENVLLRKKILVKFKKLKWKQYVFHANRKFFKRYLKYKIKNIRGYSVTAKPNKWSGAQSKHRNLLQAYKRFKIFYGLFSKKAVKRVIRIVKRRKAEKHVKLLLFRVMESRLDSIIYRSKFSYSSKSARQLIMHGNVSVNGNVITNPAFHTKIGDLVKIARTRENFMGILHRIYLHTYDRVWPHPPSHLHINYKTLEIIVGLMTYESLATCFHFDLKPEEMVFDYYYK
jgi:ribosomal protein S4